jgi:hypothetical protein
LRASSSVLRLRRAVRVFPQPSAVRLFWSGDAGRIYAHSTWLQSAVRFARSCPRCGASVSLGGLHMSGIAGSPDVSLVLRLQIGQPSVQHWEDVPDNSPDAPGRRTPPANLLVIYAKHKPRLTAQELRARQRRAVDPVKLAASVEVSCSRGEPGVGRGAPERHRSKDSRAWWNSWSAPVVAAAVLCTGTPLF